MFQTIINSFKPKDFYDLQTLLEVNGYSESEAKSICDFIDSKGRTDLDVRKCIGKIANRNEMNMDDLVLINNKIKHLNINELDFDLSGESNARTALAKKFMKHLLTKASEISR